MKINSQQLILHHHLFKTLNHFLRNSDTILLGLLDHLNIKYVSVQEISELSQTDKMPNFCVHCLLCKEF